MKRERRTAPWKSEINCAGCGYGAVAPAAAAPAPAPAMPAAGGNENRVLSQAEIDALFAAMT